MIYTLTLNPALDREYRVSEIEFDSVMRAAETRVDWGGKGFNVSRLLHGLDQSSVALGFVGGKSGEQLEAGLAELGIQTNFVHIAEETRTNVTIVTDSGEQYLKVNEAGPHISTDLLEKLKSKISSLLKKEDWWVLAGSLPPGVTTNFYAEIAKMIEEAGGCAIVDTSGEALTKSCEATPYLIKPNAVEASQLTGLPIETLGQQIDAAVALRSLGPQNVVMSLGKEGAIWVSEKAVLVGTSPTVKERNPIGAGDSMVGGLVYGLSNKMEFAECLRWGLACGAATASLEGTAVGSQTLVKSLLSKVSVTH